MDILISINCDNDAFRPTPRNEVLRILAKLRDAIAWNDLKLKDGGHMAIMDLNGLKVGEVNVNGEQ